jgi:CBS-domain-containing membrane protein
MEMPATKEHDATSEVAGTRYSVKVRDVMTTEVVTVGPKAAFGEMVDALLEHDISGLPVVDAQGALVGIVTEADLIAKEAYTGEGRRRHLGMLRDLLRGHDTSWVKKASARVAADVMTTTVDTVPPDEDVTVAARRMLDGRHKRLPVCACGRLVGIVSRHDLLKPFHRSDAQIEADLRDLLAEPLRVPEEHKAAASVSQGVVTLRGTTRFPSDIGVLVAVVSRVPGVIAVDNCLRAREQEADPATASLHDPRDP